MDFQGARRTDMNVSSRGRRQDRGVLGLLVVGHSFLSCERKQAVRGTGHQRLEVWYARVVWGPFHVILKQSASWRVLLGFAAAVAFCRSKCGSRLLQPRKKKFATRGRTDDFGASRSAPAAVCCMLLECVSHPWAPLCLCLMQTKRMTHALQSPPQI